MRASLALLVAVVTIASGSTAAYAAPDPLRGGGKAIVRIDAPKIDVEKVDQNQYRITLPASAKGQWLGTRQKTLMIGELTARDLVNGWSALGHKRDSKVATTIKWKPAGGKVQFIPAQISQAKKLADGRTTFDVTSVSAIPSQLTNASLNLARASGPSLRSYPQTQTYSFTGDIRMLSVIQGLNGPVGEILQSTEAGTCWQTTLPYANATASLNVSCGGTSVSGSLKWTYTVIGTSYDGTYLYYGNNVIFSGNVGGMSYSANIASWAQNPDCATCGSYDVT